ncbi:MAG: tol-pal system YbgF family protein [Deltaproteobacteria bacterium]
MPSALALALLLSAPQLAEPAPVVKAQALERQGDVKGAFALLEAAAAAEVDPALQGRYRFEAARLADERLHDPLRAAKLYGDYVSAFPQGPYAQLARDRQHYLVTSSGPTPEALAEYDDSLRAFSRGDIVPSLHRVEDVVLRYPAFPLRARACFWLSNALRNRKDLAGAERWLRVIVTDMPGSEDARRAELAIGALRQQAFEFGSAIDIYQRYVDSPDPLAREIARTQLAFSIEGRRWRRLYFAGLLLLGLSLVCLVLGVVRRRAPLWPLPWEVRLFLPIAALLTALTFRLDSRVGVAVTLIFAGGALLATLEGAYLRVAAPGTLARLLHLGLAVGAAASLAYCAIYGVNLTDLVVTTLEQGADR